MSPHEALRDDGKRQRELVELDRKISPKFPTIAEATERKRRRRENYASRGLLLATIIGILYALIFHNSIGYIVAANTFAFFVVVVIVAGSRHGAYGTGSDVP